MRYGRCDEAVAFFKFFATLSPEFREGTLAAVQTRMGNGDHPNDAARAVRLLQAYELMLWAA